MSVLGVDTSTAVPALVTTHPEHERVLRRVEGDEIALVGHAVVETYSVLTRLPGDLRVAPVDAARLIGETFSPPLTLGRKRAARVSDVLAELGVAGGAAYDALVALAAVEHDVLLLTRDARARATYEAVGARVEIAG